MDQIRKKYFPVAPLYYSKFLVSELVPAPTHWFPLPRWVGLSLLTENVAFFLVGTGREARGDREVDDDMKTKYHYIALEAVAVRPEWIKRASGGERKVNEVREKQHQQQQ